MNELNRHKKSDKIKWVITAIALVLAFVMIAGICMQIFAKDDKYKPSNWFDKTEQNTPATPDDEKGGAVIVTPEEEESGLIMQTKVIPRAMFASYGIESRATSAHEVNVTFTPANTTNKKVTLTAAWKNPASTWAKGKVVTDYLKLTQDANQAPHGTFQVLKSFGEPIEIKAVSVMKPSVTATGRVDYVARGYQIKSVAGKGSNYLFTDANTVEQLYRGIDVEDDDYYTVMPDRVEGTMTFELNSAVRTALMDVDTDHFDGNGSEYTDTFNINDSLCLECLLFGASNCKHSGMSNSTKTDIADAIYRAYNGNISGNISIGEISSGLLKFYYNDVLIYSAGLDASEVMVSSSFITSNIILPNGASMPSWAV